MSKPLTFITLKKAFLDSGYEIRFFPAHELESLALDAPYGEKRHMDTNIMGLIMPDEMVIGLAKELSTDDRAETLLHELIHLYDEELTEDEVEEMTLDLANNLTPAQFGFLQFLAS